MAYQGLHSLPHHDESGASLWATPDRVFALIDDHERLTSHMSRSSLRMGGGRMQTRVDEGRRARIRPGREAGAGTSGMTDRIVRISDQKHHAQMLRMRAPAKAHRSHPLHERGDIIWL